MRSRVPRLWTSEAGASWEQVGRAVDAHAIAQTVMAQLTGGVFLTGFALALGAGSFMIGLLAAIPLATKVAQLVLSWWIERAGHWRRWTIAGAAVSRTSLLLVAVLAVTQGYPSIRLALLVAILALSSLAASVFELSFLTWMAELIPEPLRGVFWGKRGRNAGIVGIIASILASLLLDKSSATSSALQPGFAVVFGAGALIGIGGIVFLRTLPAPRRQHSREDGVDLASTLRTPLRDRNYRLFLIFSALWSFTSGAMAPFYMVYMLRRLDLSFLEVTILTAITNSLMALTQTHWGRLGDHFGTKPVLRIGAYLIALTPLMWLATAPGRAWPVVIVQILSGVGWSAFHVSQSNLVLKLAPADNRPSYLGSFGAATGLAEGTAPLIGGALLALIATSNVPTVRVFHVMMLIQLVLFAVATFVPRWIVEPGGTAVGHLIRVMARFRQMDASQPVSLVLEYGYTHLARIADLIAREFPRDAE
ncbi:MAG TPA: MFS transporter [Gemmatimonadaceae bacterium]|nr:MFS transporter [Gemmatimonadaceae bacterium]